MESRQIAYLMEDGSCSNMSSSTSKWLLDGWMWRTYLTKHLLLSHHRSYIFVRCKKFNGKGDFIFSLILSCVSNLKFGDKCNHINIVIVGCIVQCPHLCCWGPWNLVRERHLPVHRSTALSVASLHLQYYTLDSRGRTLAGYNMYTHKNPSSIELCLQFDERYKHLFSQVKPSRVHEIL